MKAGTVALTAVWAAAAAAMCLWLVTGREGYTRWPDARLAAADAAAAPGESDLLAAAGFSDARPAAPDIQSRFAFGLVPGGADPKHLLSVASLTGIASIVSATVVAARWLKSSKKPVPPQGAHP